MLLNPTGIYFERLTHILKVKGIEVKTGRHFFVGGLCFLGIDVSAERVEDIVLFTGVRALRKMPSLRFL